MGNPIQYIRRSLSRKLSLTIVLFAAILFNLALGFVFRQSLTAVRIEAIKRATVELDNTVLRAGSLLHRVEVATKNTEWLIPRHLDAPDSMFVYSQMILENNPYLSGCSIAFEPNYFREQGQGLYFSAYSYNDNGTILTTQEGNDYYQYFYMDWYQTAKLLDRPVWSEPFLDYNPADIYAREMIASYCSPLKDEDGNYIGTISVDISLEWLSNTISSVRPYRHSYSMMLGQGGTYFVHPDTTKLFYQTIFTESMEHPDPAMVELGHAMLRGEEGYRQLRVDGEDCYVFFKPLDITGWSVAIVCPESDIFGGFFRLRSMVYVIVAIGLLLILIVFSRIVTLELRPLRRLADQAGVIAKGNFNEKLPVSAHREDEIGRLGKSFGEMQESLVRYIEELRNTTASKAAIDNELKVASAIQESMVPNIFPPFPERNDIDLYASMATAKDVGGDLFDFFLRNEKLFFCVGDVSGKGIPASMVMAVTLSLIRSNSNRESDPARVVQSVNETLSQRNESMMFVTLFLGVLDLPTGRLRYCSAGHDCPLILSGGKLANLDCKPNLPIGIEPKMRFSAQESILSPDSTLFLYTDGLTEAMNSAYALYGLERVHTELQALGSELPPRQLIEKMSASVHGFVGEAEQSDDLTMMAIRYTPGEFQTILSESLTLFCDISRIAELSRFLDDIAERLEIDPVVTQQIQLAAEEVVVNVMNYAYNGRKKGYVTIKAASDGHTLKITVIDAGVAFDPTAKEKADTTLSAEERPIGGLGIFLVREMMDSVNYERVDHRNILTISKKIK